MFEQLSWTELLRRWSDELVEFAPGVLDAAPTSGGDHWLGSPPALGADIAAAEARLGISLPPSYREFLKITNGWPVTGDLVRGIRPVGEVGWFRDIESEWYEIWRDIGAENELPDDATDGYPLMARALVVSTPGEEALLLDPARVDPDTGEWYCCRFSNSAPGASDGCASFRQGMDTAHDRFVAAHVTAGPTIDTINDAVDDAYRRSLAGDLAAGAVFHEARPTSWRAWALACQFDAFAAKPYEHDSSTSVQPLWWGNLGAVTAAQALADPVVLDELVPLFVVRLIESNQSLDWELHRAPPPMAERMRAHLAAIDSGTGIVADFSYSPEFAAGVEQARLVLPKDPDAAWRTIVTHLPLWKPRGPHHLAPIGLRYDKDLRRLVNPPPSPPSTPPAFPARAGHEVYTVILASTFPPTPSQPVTAREAMASDGYRGISPHSRGRDVLSTARGMH